MVVNGKERPGVETQRNDNGGAALVECVGQFAHVSALRPQHHRLDAVEREVSHELRRQIGSHESAREGVHHTRPSAAAA